MSRANQRGTPADADGSSQAAASNNLRRRVVSAAVLGPVAIASAYIGGWLFLAVCAVTAGLILWEWTSLVVRVADRRILAPGLLALVAAMVFVGTDQGAAAVGMITIGAALAGGFVAVWPRPYPAPNPPLWACGGVIYAGAAFLGPALLRQDPQLGFVAVAFLAATVWITDIFAYFIGRAVGGPLLWPAVSPSKTWSGAIGGTAGGVAGGALVAYASGVGSVGVLGVLALILSVLAQGGDLFESAVKRRFGVKDSSQLIPGHGGLMDRLDGFLVAGLAALLIGVLRQGTGAAAAGLLVW